MNEIMQWKNCHVFWVVLVTLIVRIVLFVYLLSINKKIEQMRWQLMTIENRLGDTNGRSSLMATETSLVGWTTFRVC